MGCTKKFQIVLFLWLATATTLALGQGTRVGFYSTSCPRAEAIVGSVIRTHFQSDPTVAPALLRLHFHDCFVRGCDASILIDGPTAEKMAGPNRSLKGFEVIDDAKKQLEAACPGIVSCADILAIAARDAVVLTKGIGWQVPTGRRDGNVSVVFEAYTLPSFHDSVDAQKQNFASKGLNTQDLVTLVGGHTIGTSQCLAFSYRLYNFNNTGAADPSIDTAFLPQLQSLCPHNGDPFNPVALDLNPVALDNGSPDNFDTSFFTNLKNGRGILQSDQNLWNDPSTRTFVEQYMGNSFAMEFGKSMVKMGNVEVKTGTNGEIRSVCSKIN